MNYIFVKFDKIKQAKWIYDFLNSKIPISNLYRQTDSRIMRNHKLSIQLIVLILISLEVTIGAQYKSTSIGPDNVCTFHIADKLFSLIYLQGANPYVINISPDDKIMFNFCHSFIPNQCQTNTSATNSTGENNQTIQNSSVLQAFAYYVQKQVIQTRDSVTNQTTSTTQYTCTPYTSNSYLYYFNKDYIKHNSQPQLVLNLTTADNTKATVFRIACSDEDYFDQESFQFLNNNNLLLITGESSSGCPVFQISSLWTTLQEHQVILGIILFCLGFQLLFYGLLMINVTVFIAGYFISFAIIGGIFTVFLGPDSSSIAVYFSLLFILLASTILAYGLTKLINVSIFFIGAFFGLILGALINTIFSSMFSMHSVWSLVFFEVLFTIPFGLMTFKYSNEIIIISTSLTGSYFMVRPISWILGGFPNEFLLYEMYASRQLSTVPWTFYVYLLIIVIHAFMGASYQYLKLQRQDANNTIMTNAVTQNIEQPLDKIKETVDKLIARYSASDAGDERYKKMKEMDNQRQSFEEYAYPQVQYGQIGDTNQRKSKQKKGRGSKEDEYF